MTATPGARDRRATWAAAALVVVAALLRMRGLTSFILEQDELYTLRDAAHLPLHASVSGPGIGGRPLYYLLQHLLLAVGPATPLLLRVLPLVFGVLGVWVTWRLGRRLFGDAGGLVAAALVAFSPWHLYASGMARYWSLVYLLAAAAVLLLFRALERDRPSAYLAAAAVVTLGAITHPSFVFALIGVCAALFLVDGEGRLRLRLPRRRELAFLWGPLAVAGVVFIAVVKIVSGSGALRNWGGRGIAATLRTVPAMVEWIGLPIVVAGLLAVAYLVLAPRMPDRRAGLAALGAAVSCIPLMLVAGLKTDVYADYGMGMLPLLYVTIGGVVVRVGERLAPAARRWWTGAAVAVLLSAALPGVVSNLVDGMRFDYRPAFAYVERHGPERLVIGEPLIEQRHYAPGLRFVELPPEGAAGLARLAREEGGVWFVASYSRLGLQYGDDDVREWIDRSCHTMQRTQRPRLDYRSYRVDLAWCGAAPPPGTAPAAATPPAGAH